MGIHRIFDNFKSTSLLIKHRVYLLLPVAFFAAMAGCSSSLTQVNTWEGDQPAESAVAILKVPGEIQIEQVNGRSMTNYLIDDLALDYALLPGKNEIVFSYKTIWAKSGIVKNGESKVHIIKSEPQIVQLMAEPGEVYKFSYQKPESRRDAKQMMPTFSANVVTGEGVAVAQSRNWTPARTSVPSQGATVEAEGVDGDTLEALKAIWATATEEDKKTFLRWAFE